jgi:hypothetical protein
MDRELIAEEERTLIYVWGGATPKSITYCCTFSLLEGLDVTILAKNVEYPVPPIPLALVIELSRVDLKLRKSPTGTDYLKRL